MYMYVHILTLKILVYMWYEYSCALGPIQNCWLAAYQLTAHIDNYQKFKIVSILGNLLCTTQVLGNCYQSIHYLYRIKVKNVRSQCRRIP